MSKRLYLTISVGDENGPTRPVIVSNDQDLIRRVAPVIGESIGLEPERVKAELDDTPARVVPLHGRPLQPAHEGGEGADDDGG